MLEGGLQTFAEALNSLVVWLISFGFKPDIAANLATDGFVITLATAVISIAISLASKWKLKRRRAEINKRLWQKLFHIIEKHRENLRLIPRVLKGMVDIRDRPEVNAYKVGYTAASFTRLKSMADELLTEFAALPVIVGAASPHAGDGVLDFVENEFSALNLLAIEYKSFSESADHFLKKHNKAEDLVFDSLEYDCGWMHGFSARIELNLAKKLSRRARVMAWVRREGLKGDFERSIHKYWEIMSERDLTADEMGAYSDERDGGLFVKKPTSPERRARPRKAKSPTKASSHRASPKPL